MRGEATDTRQSKSIRHRTTAEHRQRESRRISDRAFDVDRRRGPTRETTKHTGKPSDEATQSTACSEAAVWRNTRSRTTTRHHSNARPHSNVHAVARNKAVIQSPHTAERALR